MSRFVQFSVRVTLPTIQYVFKTYGLESRSDGDGPYGPNSRQLTTFHLRHYDSRVVVPVCLVGQLPG